MKKIPIRFLLLIHFFIFPFCFPWTVSAHGGEPRLELSAERLNPGATLEIRGVNFDLEIMVKLSLVGTNVEKALGEIMTDPEGGFTLVILLPADLPEGTYRIRAVSDEHDLTSPWLSVTGSAILSQEEGQRGEEEALLAAMPTLSPAFPTSPASMSKNQKNESASPTRNLWMAIVLGMGGIVLGSGLRVLIQYRGR